MDYATGKCQTIVTNYPQLEKKKNVKLAKKGKEVGIQLIRVWERKGECDPNKLCEILKEQMKIF